MLDRLPEYIDPLQLADKRCELKGQIPLSSMDRLAGLLANDSGAVTVELFFGREGKLAKIEGQIQAVLELECQNCLGAMQWAVTGTVKLGIVTSIDQANKLPADYEPLLVEDGKISLNTVIEDELLLSLPAFPRHQHDCFHSDWHNDTVESSLHKEQSPTENPFSILAKLKNIGDS
jgi:uncharacterized protein